MTPSAKREIARLNAVLGCVRTWRDASSQIRRSRASELLVGVFDAYESGATLRSMKKIWDP